MAGLGKRIGLLLTAACLTTAVTAGTAEASRPATLYVAPHGWGLVCTKHLPCALGDVQKRTATHKDVVVYLRGGTYRLDKTLELTPENTGRNGGSVAYRAYPGERPVLSGAKRIKGFTLADQARDIYRAPVPAGSASRQLYVNGVRAERARTELNPAKFTATATGFSTDDPSYAKLSNQSDIEIAYNYRWKHMRCPLSSIEPSGTGSALTVQPDCWKTNNLSVVNRQFPFNGNGLPKLNGVTWVENAYELLTKPGQWYLDREANALFYIPRPGERIQDADVELPFLETLVSAKGRPGHIEPVDDTDPGAVYSGQWQNSGNRAFGDYQDGVHVTKEQGASVTYTFDGTGLDVLGETNTDQGTFTATVDGKPAGTYSQKGEVRQAQQVVYSVKNLRKGKHTVTLTSTSTDYLLIDAFVVTPDVITPVRDLSFSGITFTGTTWNLPSVDGYLDNQAGVQWAAKAPHAPVLPAAALEIHRGRGVTIEGNTFTHLGGTGVSLDDGTQSSKVVRNTVSDTAAGGISIGEVDDYYLTDTARMTLDVTVAHNTVETAGQDYRDAVGIWVGHSRRAVVAQNEVRDLPYTGISLGWGWGFQSPCELQAKQGLKACRRGTIYSGENKILGNRIHNVMNVLEDGGAIYTLGGQGDGGGTTTSEVAGNWVYLAPHNNNMLYHDEGSSYWDTHDNVVSNASGFWTGMWTPTIHTIAVHDNFTDNPAVKDKGTNVTFTNNTVVTDGVWPDKAKAIMAASGPR